MRTGYYNDKRAKMRRKRLTEGLPNLSWGAYIWCDRRERAHTLAYEKVAGKWKIECGGPKCPGGRCVGKRWLARFLKKYELV